MSWQQAVLSVLTKRKRVPNIDCVRVDGGKTHSSTWLALSDKTYSNVVIVHAEKHRYIWHMSPLIPQVAPVCLTLHRQCYIYYGNVFTSWETKWPILWFDCDESLICQGLNLNTGHFCGSTLLPLSWFVWRIVFDYLVVCRLQVRHSGQRRGSRQK
jgi:hypothetical protein